MPTTTIETSAGPMVIDEEELQIGRFLDADGNIPTHEDVLAFMRRHVKEGDNVIDVGANAGFFTLALAEMVGPTGRVTAFEPNVSILRNLDQSVQDRGLANVYTVNTGVGAHAYWATLRHDPRGPGGTQVIKETENEGYVLVLPLDESPLIFTRRHPVSFIKIDTEGMDVDVLWGAHDILSKDRPVVLFEWNPDALASLQKSARHEQKVLCQLLYDEKYALCDYRTDEEMACLLVNIRPGDYALIPKERL